MVNAPALRKFGLTAHIVLSIGWLGAVVPYLALALLGLVSREPQTIRAIYLSLDLMCRFAIVPLSLAGLASGVIQSLFTSWGLFRHWWVLAKFFLTITAVIVLLRHMEAVSRMSQMVLDNSFPGSGMYELQIQLAVHAAGGLAVLVAITGISVFKPWGLTFFGRRVASRPYLSARLTRIGTLLHSFVYAETTPRWDRLVGMHVAGLILLLALAHFTGQNLAHH